MSQTQRSARRVWTRIAQRIKLHERLEKGFLRTLLEAIQERTLFALEAGNGTPAVLFEAGLEDFSRAWHQVQAAVTKHTRTISYDRAGRGQSQSAGGNQTCRDVADDLNLLTEKLGLAEPFIFVGHSFGGFVARAFAQRYPDRLAAVV